MKKFLALLALTVVFTGCVATKNDIARLQNQIDEIRDGGGSDSQAQQMPEPVEFEAVFVSAESDFSTKIESIKEKIFQKMNYEVVTPDSEKGKALIAKFSAKNLPMMVVGEKIKETPIKDYLDQLATESDGEFNVKIADISAQLGVEISKTFLQTPKNLPHDAVKGPANAKVVFIEISDFECPFCGKFHNEAYKQIVETYGDQIQFRFKHLPLGFHQHAQKAAEAAQCANKQGKFWEMHDKLFSNQKELSVDNYKKWAGELGLDQSSFDTCLDNGETESEVAAQAAQAEAFGIQGTPGVFVNDKFVGGAYPFSYFQKLIDAELAK